MAQYMNRTPGLPGASNYENPTVGPYQFYEARYVTAGPQEWIFAPDAGAMYVTVFFPQGGAAFIEGTDESPADINASYTTAGLPQNLPSSNPMTVTPLLHYSHNYPLTDIVTDVTRIKVEGCTAVRINVVGGSADVTVRV